jgi:hypothetical protein
MPHEFELVRHVTDAVIHHSEVRGTSVICGTCMIGGTSVICRLAGIGDLSLASWKDQGASRKYARSQHIDLLK